MVFRDLEVFKVPLCHSQIVRKIDGVSLETLNFSSRTKFSEKSFATCDQCNDTCLICYSQQQIPFYLRNAAYKLVLAQQVLWVGASSSQLPPSLIPTPPPTAMQHTHLIPIAASHFSPFQLECDGLMENKDKRKQGRIQGNPVTDGWAGAVMQKPLGIQKCDVPTFFPTDRHGKF